MNWYKKSKRNYKKEPITDPRLLYSLESLGFDERLEEKPIKNERTKEEQKKINNEWREQEYEHMPA